MNDSQVRGSRRGDACAVLVALGLPSLVTVCYFVWLAEFPAAVQQTAYTVGKVVQFAFPLVWVVAVRRRRPRAGRPELRGLLEGLAFGLFVLAAMLLLYHAWLKPAGLFAVAEGEIRRKVIGFGVGGFWSYVALGAFYATAHSFLEEYYWRWFVFGQLREMVSLRVAILVSSLGFMAHHVLLLATYFGWLSAATIVFSLAVAVGGAVWAWLYQRSGSLYGPWLSHLLVDAAIFVVGYDMVWQVFGS